MGRKWQVAILALVLALFSWYQVTGRERVEAWVRMPIEMTNPPEGMVVLDGMVNDIEVRVRGPRGLVRTFVSSTPHYSLNMNGLRPGENVYSFENKDLPVPEAIEVMEVKPPRLTIEADRVAKRRLRVLPELLGDVPENYHLVSVNATPSIVELRGPAAALDRMEAVATRPVPMPDTPIKNYQAATTLELPEEVVSDQETVNLDITFEEDTRRLWVKVPLVVRKADSIKAKVEQDSIRLHLDCPVSFYEMEHFRSDVTPWVSVGPNLLEGKHSLPFEVDLPTGCRVVQSKPSTIDVIVKKAADSGRLVKETDNKTNQDEE